MLVRAGLGQGQFRRRDEGMLVGFGALQRVDGYPNSSAVGSSSILIPEPMNNSASLCGLKIDGLQVKSIFEIVASISWTDVPQDSPCERGRA